MRTLCVVAAVICLPVCGLAQARIILQSHLRAEPVSSGLQQRFGLMNSTRINPGGVSLSTRTYYDKTNHIYFGYEAMVEEQQPGAYLVTFGRLGLTPLDLAAGGLQPPTRINPAEWTNQPLPAIPGPQLVHDGDVIRIELFVDAATNAELFDDIEIGAPAVRALPGGAGAIFQNLTVPGPPLPPLTMSGGMILPNRGAVPRVEGTARDFTAADAEMQIRQPRITLNGAAQPIAGRGPAVVNGSLIWFYLPGRGRYILSLAPRPELDFQKAGEVRGGSIKFTLGGDTVTLECPIEIASGHAPYVLYVSRDPLWEPTAQAQKGQFAIGSVDAGELVELKRQ
jgi:hypothetical protein